MRWRSATWLVGSLILSAQIGTGAAPAAKPLPCRDRAYVANSYQDTLSVIDTRANSVVATIPMKTPYDPQIATDGRHVYVSNGGDGTVSLVDVATNMITSKLQIGKSATGLAFTPDGKRLLVTSGGATIEDKGSVRIVELSSGKMSDPIEVGRTPERVTVSPDGKRAYVVSRDMMLFVVDIDRKAVVDTVPMPYNAFNMLFTPKGDKMYLAFRGTDMVGVLDIASKKIETIKGEAGPIGLSFNPDKRKLYVTNGGGNSIQEISVAEGKVIKSVKIGDKPGTLRLTPDGKYAYVTYSSAKDVGVVDLSTMRQVASIPTGAPTTIAICGSPSR